MNFGNWPESVHNSEAQKRRIENALSKDIRIIKLYKRKNRAKLKGTTEKYITSLNDCSCFDFSLRNLPCKHIYRLAHELGYIHIQVKNPDTIYTFDKTFDTLSDDVAQQLIYYMSYLSIYHNKIKILVTHSQSIKLLIDSKLCRVKTYGYFNVADDMSASDLKRIFNEVPIENKPSSTSQKRTFLKWIREHEDENISLLQEYFLILEFTDLGLKNRHKIHRRLYKKYERTLWF